MYCPLMRITTRLPLFDSLPRLLIRCMFTSIPPLTSWLPLKRSSLPQWRHLPQKRCLCFHLMALFLSPALLATLAPRLIQNTVVPPRDIL
jgi:hypothetical protein